MQKLAPALGCRLCCIDHSNHPVDAWSRLCAACSALVKTTEAQRAEQIKKAKELEKKAAEKAKQAELDKVEAERKKKCAEADEEARIKALKLKGGAEKTCTEGGCGAKFASANPKHTLCRGCLSAKRAPKAAGKPMQRKCSKCQAEFVPALAFHEMCSSCFSKGKVTPVKVRVSDVWNAFGELRLPYKRKDKLRCEIVSALGAQVPVKIVHAGVRDLSLCVFGERCPTFHSGQCPRKHQLPNGEPAARVRAKASSATGPKPVTYASVVAGPPKVPTKANPVGGAGAPPPTLSQLPPWHQSFQWPAPAPAPQPAPTHAPAPAPQPATTHAPVAATAPSAVTVQATPSGWDAAVFQQFLQFQEMQRFAALQQQQAAAPRQ